MLIALLLYTDLAVVGSQFHFSNTESNVVLDKSESPHLIAREGAKTLICEHNVPIGA